MSDKDNEVVVCDHPTQWTLVLDLEHAPIEMRRFDYKHQAEIVLANFIYRNGESSRNRCYIIPPSGEGQ